MPIYSTTSSDKTRATGLTTQTLEISALSRTKGRQRLKFAEQPANALKRALKDEFQGPLTRGKNFDTNKRLAGLNVQIATVSFADVYAAAPQQRIELVKRGVAPSMLSEIAEGISTTEGRVMEILGLKRTTIARKRADPSATLSQDDSEKLVGLARIAGQVEVMVRESGDLTGFDPGKWLTAWLNEPIEALDGQKPADYMDTNEGQALVSNLLLQIQHGVYA